MQRNKFCPLQALALGFLAALFPGGCKPAADATAPPATLVTVATVEERSVQDYVVFTGRTEAVETVEVRARVSGYLAETRFKDGQEVKKGDVLFVIDPRPYQADLDRATAETNRAEAEVQLAGVEFNRARELRQKNAISAQDFDVKSAALLKAQSGLAAARAAMDTAKLNLDFTSITAPIDGRASRASVTPGNLITPDMPQPLTVLVSVDPVYAYADLDERQLLRYIRLHNEEAAQAGSGKTETPDSPPIWLQLADEKDFPHEGRIDFSDNRVNRETGTLEIRGVFEDTDNVLGPGMFVRLRFPAGPRRDALLVPQEAIATDQGRKLVYVVDGKGVVEARTVEPESIQDDGWRVVRGNLKAGEKVIVEGLVKVRPGMEVRTEAWKASDVPSGSSPAVTTDADTQSAAKETPQ